MPMRRCFLHLCNIPCTSAGSVQPRVFLNLCVSASQSVEGAFFFLCKQMVPGLDDVGTQSIMAASRCTLHFVCDQAYSAMQCLAVPVAAWL